MSSLAGILGFLLLTVAAAAQQPTADLSIELLAGASTPPRVQVGADIFHFFTIKNFGPDIARDVTVSIDAPQAQSFRIEVAGCLGSVQCNIGNLGVDEQRTFRVLGIYARLPVTAFTTARVTASTFDPNPDNNSATAVTEILSLPDLFSGFDVARPAEPEQAVTARMFAVNSGAGPAHDVVLETQLPPGSKITAVRPAAGWDCTTILTTITCRTPVLGGQSAGQFAGAEMKVDFITPPLYEGGTLPVVTHVSSSDDDFFPQNNTTTFDMVLYKFFPVTSTGDAGPGTLRQAILDANALCDPKVLGICRIAFRLPGPVPEPGWFTIQPLSPLPEIRTSVTILGPGNASQQGQRPRPQVFLDGSRVGTGDGLDLLSGDGTVAQLAIGNFPGNGISVTGGSHSIRDSFIGTDPTGNVAAPNLRGIAASGSQQLGILHNVISGNQRTGVILSNIFRPQLVENAIGLAADGESPLPNGASGVYLAEGCDWAFLWINDLAYNRDFGVAMHPTVTRALISLNAIYGNGQLGIDYGVDSSTPNSQDDSRRMPNYPIVTSARYDAASNRTFISGTNESGSLPDVYRVELYASPVGDPPQAKTFLGSFPVQPRAPFQVSVPGDYRGQFITGILIRFFKLGVFDPVTTEQTSEIGPAAKVD